MQKSAPLARARVTDFHGGVYKEFVVAGPARYVVRVGRNHSFGTKLQGVFIDRLAGDPPASRKPLPGFDTVGLQPRPILKDKSAVEGDATLSTASGLWDTLADSFDRKGVTGLQFPLRIAAYRAAAAGDAPDALLATWRWQMGIWTKEDRDAYEKAMAAAFKAWSEKNPRPQRVSDDGKLIFKKYASENPCGCILLGFVAASGIAAAQIPTRSSPGTGARVPKLVPALGWDIAKQGGFATSVTVDAQNNVWVGTEDKGLWRYDSRKKEWTQFTSQDGLGDNSIYALAVDKLGRVWAGHLNHGVSVWNGDKWQNYGVVDGPLGSRVFAIAMCPTDGDVWIATEVGVARYSLADDDWDYFTRASGLPSNQIQAIAFDAKGNIYLGTQCDGIAMADAKDKYQKWAVAAGLPQMPNAATGSGLGSSLINDMAMAIPPQNAVMQGEAERLVVATPLGLSTSSDYGDHFNLIRGEDWQDNVKGLFEPPAAPASAAGPGGHHQRGGPMVFGGGGGAVFVGGGVVMLNGGINAVGAQQRFLLMEDWANCVHQEKDTGRLWIGYRQKGLEIRNFGITPSIRYDTGRLGFAGCPRDLDRPEGPRVHRRL